MKKTEVASSQFPVAIGIQLVAISCLKPAILILSCWELATGNWKLWGDFLPETGNTDSFLLVTGAGNSLLLLETGNWKLATLNYGLPR